MADISEELHMQLMYNVAEFMNAEYGENSWDMTVVGKALVNLILQYGSALHNAKGTTIREEVEPLLEVVKICLDNLEK